MLQEDKPCIVMLQETAFSANEAKAFLVAVSKLGYNGFFAGAQKTSARLHGDAMVLVNKSIAVQPAWSYTCLRGAARAI